MQRWQCPIYNGTLKSMNYISMFFVYFTCLFLLVLCKIEETLEKLSKIKTYRVRDVISNIFDKIVVWRLPLYTGHCHLCMKGFLKITRTVPLILRYLAPFHCWCSRKKMCNLFLQKYSFIALLLLCIIYVYCIIVYIVQIKFA